MKFYSSHPIFVTASAVVTAGILCASAGQSVNLTGIVKDSSTQQAISGATVSLKGLSLSTTTDANGGYLLAGNSIRSLKSSSPFNYSPVFQNNALFFGVANNGERVRLEVFDPSGRRIAALVDEKVSQGSYRINPLAAMPIDKIYLVKLQTGDRTAIFKAPLVQDHAAPPGGISRNSSLAKVSAVTDTLVVSAAGYKTVQKAISSYAGVNDFLLAANSGHRGIISFENGSYQSCIVPLVITLVDSDLVGPTVPVKVKSTTDPAGITVPLKKIPGLVGAYSDSVFFSIVKSDSAKKLIEVRDQDVVAAYYADASPPQTDSVSTTWAGQPATVQPGGSPFLGVITPMPIHVWDPDVTDSSLTVWVKSKKDTVGFAVKLLAAGGAGDFFGQVWFSLKGSSGDSVLAVMGAVADTISIVYHDLTPRQDIAAGYTIWLPVLGIMFLDSAAYHGIAGSMTINLSDNDIADSTAVVSVTSKKDPAGIKDTLRVTGTTIRNFIGTVGFTTGASRPGFISVADGDTVKVTYMDDSPVQPVTQTAVWHSQ